MSNKLQLDITWDPIKAQSNIAKHGVSFVQAASVLLDALALTVFDTAHSEFEERWFTLGMSSEGKLLALSHTHQYTGLPRRKYALFQRARPPSVNVNGMRMKPVSLQHNHRHLTR